jgi:hypothetical protein
MSESSPLISANLYGRPSFIEKIGVFFKLLTLRQCSNARSVIRINLIFLGFSWRDSLEVYLQMEWQDQKAQCG